MIHLTEPIDKINEAIKKVTQPTLIANGLVYPLQEKDELQQYNTKGKKLLLWDDAEVVIYHKHFGDGFRKTQARGKRQEYQMSGDLRLYCISHHKETYLKIVNQLCELPYVEIIRSNTNKAEIILSETGNLEKMNYDRHIFYIEYRLITHTEKCLDLCR